MNVYLAQRMVPVIQTLKDRKKRITTARERGRPTKVQRELQQKGEETEKMEDQKPDIENSRQGKVSQ